MIMGIRRYFVLRSRALGPDSPFAYRIVIRRHLETVPSRNRRLLSHELSIRPSAIRPAPIHHLSICFSMPASMACVSVTELQCHLVIHTSQRSDIQQRR